MRRHQNQQWAQETVAICEAGAYVTASGHSVNIATEISQAKAGTVIYSPQNPLPAAPQRSCNTRIEVANETTFSALRRLAADNGHIACLNFASAKNPGGGFLSGAQAQEEALARASALYPCLLTQPDYYERNRANRSAIYLDLIIYSPRVPFFRDDTGQLLAKPVLASVITAPAPNAGAVAQNEPGNLSLVAPALRRRAELVLRIAQSHAVDTLVLGAWGCGVFRNDPALVASTFAELLRAPGPFAGVFSKVVFAVYDRSESQTAYETFAKVFRGAAGSLAR